MSIANNLAANNHNPQKAKIFTGGEAYFFARMPHMAVHDLSPGAYKLLGHFIRRAGNDNVCWEGQTSLQKELGKYKNKPISVNTLRKWREELEAKNYITVEQVPDPSNGGWYYQVSIVHWWNENRARFDEDYRQLALNHLESGVGFEAVLDWFWSHAHKIRLTADERSLLRRYGYEESSVEGDQNVIPPGSETDLREDQKMIPSGSETDLRGDQNVPPNKNTQNNNQQIITNKEEETAPGATQPGDSSGAPRCELNLGPVHDVPFSAESVAGKEEIHAIEELVLGISSYRRKEKPQSLERLFERYKTRIDKEDAERSEIPSPAELWEQDEDYRVFLTEDLEDQRANNVRMGVTALVGRVCNQHVYYCKKHDITTGQNRSESSARSVPDGYIDPSKVTLDLDL